MKISNKEKVPDMSNSNKAITSEGTVSMFFPLKKKKKL